MRTLLEKSLLKAWSRRGLFAYLMWPLSALFGLILNFRFGLLVMGYRSQTKLEVPVIVVGNIFVGGTGKTPMVVYLVEQLRAMGWNPGVISRGHGADVEQVLEVNDFSLAKQVGDEPLLIYQRTKCPMLVGRNRVAVAQKLLANYPQVDLIISDDGLQHYALGRDVEIVMFDQRGIGNGWLLPAGPLRETARRRRDFTVLNCASETVPMGIGDDVFRMRLRSYYAINLTQPEHHLELGSLAGKSILAAAGIGNPDRFFTMLKAQGLVCRTRALADHFAFDQNIFETEQAEIILVTEKDAVKCRQNPSLLADKRIWYVPVSAELESAFIAQLQDKILEKKNGCSPA